MMHPFAYIHPSVFFEGTLVSVGRGTDKPFQQIGAPWLQQSFSEYSFVPKSTPEAKYPKHEGERCFGVDLTKFAEGFLTRHTQIYLFWLIETYNLAPEKDDFFTNFFNKLAGNSTLQKQIKDGLSEEEIRASWQEDIRTFKKIRRKYLLYEDFE